MYQVGNKPYINLTYSYYSLNSSKYSGTARTSSYSVLSDKA